MATKLLLTLYKEQNSCCSIQWGSPSCHAIPVSKVSLRNATGTNEAHYLPQHLFHSSWPVRGQEELSAIGFADVMENIRWCITKTLFLLPDCFIVPLVYIIVSLLPMTSSGVFHLSLKPTATHAAHSFWLQEVEVSMLPLTQLSGQEPRQAGLLSATAAWVSVYPACLSVDIQHSSHIILPTVHLPRSLKIESFNPARNPCSGRRIITLWRKKLAILIMLLVFLCMFQLFFHTSLQFFFSSQRNMILFYSI